MSALGPVSAKTLGGWVEKEENLQGYQAWIADEAKVWGDAVVKGEGYIGHNAQMCQKSCVEEQGKLLGNASAIGTSRVSDKAVVGGASSLSGNAVISGKAHIYGGLISGNVIICGTSDVCGNPIISGEAFIHGRTQIKRAYEISGSVWIFDSQINGNGIKILGDSYLERAILIGDMTLRDSIAIRGVFVKGNYDFNGNEEILHSEQLKKYQRFSSTINVIKIERDSVQQQSVSIENSEDSFDQFKTENVISTTRKPLESDSEEAKRVQFQYPKRQGTLFEK